MVDWGSLKGMKPWKVSLIVLCIITVTFINVMPALTEKGFFGKKASKGSSFMSLEDTRVNLLQKYQYYNKPVLDHFWNVLNSSLPISDDDIRAHIEIGFEEGWSSAYSEITRLNLCYEGASTFLKEKFTTEDMKSRAYRILSNNSQTPKLRLNSMEIYLKSYQVTAVEKLMAKLRETEKCKKS